MRILFIVCSVVVLLTGCASAYAPSENYERYASSMNTQEAKEVFYSVIMPSNGSPGLCDYASYRTDKGVTPAKTPNGFSFRAWERGEYLRTEERHGKQYKVYKKDYYIQEIKFSDFTKARVLRGQTCYGGTGDHKVMLYDSMTSSFMVDIPAGMLDKFMASLKILAPDIELMEGVGI